MAINYNSTVNQQIKRDFVGREVWACISDLADFLFSDDIGTYAQYDEFSNYWQLRCPECGLANCFDDVDIDEIEIEHTDEGYVCPVCEDVHDEEDDARLCCWHPGTEFMRCSCGAVFDKNNLDEEPAEVLEWWIVSPWLGDKLRDYGEVVLERYGGWIWGRQGTGQAILLDYVIGRICEDLEILDGQPHS